MECNVLLEEFSGPLDILLGLIKKHKFDINNLDIVKVTKQYLDYIKSLEIKDLDIPSEYLIIAAELIEIKSTSLLPKKKNEEEDDPKEEFVKKLLLYKSYKETSLALDRLIEKQLGVYSRTSTIEIEKIDKDISEDLDINLLTEAFREFLKRKKEEKPLDTVVTKKEYSIQTRSIEIKNKLKINSKISFFDLLDEVVKEYLVVTFLAVLDLVRKREILVFQDNCFENLVISAKE